jgi:tripartite-type tricarboxylate transporter receptor subunit TctC
MSKQKRSTTLCRILTAAFAIAAPPVFAGSEDYPNRTVKIVVPAPPGPMLDVLPRILADKLSARWGKPVIIENRPGAAQNLGAEAVSRAEPDGYTLLASPPGPLVVSQHLFGKLSFDPSAFVPISVMVSLPTVVVVNPKMPVSNVAELFAFAKANPNKVTYGSPGIGSTPQLAMEETTRAAGVRFMHVPYQGMGPAQRDLLAGHIDVMIDIAGNALPLINDGKLKVLAVTGEKRISALPAVPTVSETLPGFTHAEWFAMVAPPKTPPAIAAKISQAIAETLRLPDVAQRLQELSVTPVGSSPAETADFITRESDRWRKLIDATGIKID